MKFMFVKVSVIYLFVIIQYINLGESWQVHKFKSKYFIQGKKVGLLMMIKIYSDLKDFEFSRKEDWLKAV